ncbi:MAG: DUF3842 family protein [Christensenellaceae bacterium]|jgi:prephenate dehydrogenase
MKKIIVIDGQGGRIGRMFVEALKKSEHSLHIIAFGTNSIATSTMLKAGADEGATGENPILYNAGDADIIIGPIGIVIANALLGEITPAIATAISSSDAKKILIPISKCNSMVIGVEELPMSEYINRAIKVVQRMCEE